MNFFGWLIGLIITAIIGVYILVFTPIGNPLLKPILEEKINTEGNLNAELRNFSLSADNFEILLALDEYNTIYTQGTYSIVDQSFDIIYDIKLGKLENLNELTKQELTGALRTNGTAKGNRDFIRVDGLSDVASSDTNYHVELTNFVLTSIVAKMNHADLISLLGIMGKKPYADAKLDIDMNFKNITPHLLDGNIELSTVDGVLNTKLLNEELNLEIPETTFTMNLDATLKEDGVNYTYALNSNLAKVNSDGIFRPNPLEVNANYTLDVKELAVLQPITKLDLQGPYKLNGTVIGNKAEMKVKGTSDFASSDTLINVVLHDLKASSVKATMKNLELSKVLYMTKQKPYAEGFLDLEVDMVSVKKAKLLGNINTKITQGVLNSEFISKENEFKEPMPRTDFTASTYTLLNQNIADTTIDFRSPLVNLDVKELKYNIADKSINSDYLVRVPDLSKLYFVIERHLKGPLQASGTVKKAKDLDITLHSKFAGGDLDANIHNDDIHADIKSMNTRDVMALLKYPPVFYSSLNGVIDYNTKYKKGTFEGNLLNGGFDDNMAFAMVRKYAKIDLYKEQFQGNVSAKIDGENVLASFELKSNTSSIKTSDTQINSVTQIINSRIDIVANNHPVSITLRGDKSRPQVMIDPGETLKKQLDSKLGGFLKGFLQR